MYVQRMYFSMLKVPSNIGPLNNPCFCLTFVTSMWQTFFPALFLSLLLFCSLLLLADAVASAIDTSASVWALWLLMASRNVRGQSPETTLYYAFCVKRKSSSKFRFFLFSFEKKKVRTGTQCSCPSKMYSVLLLQSLFGHLRSRRAPQESSTDFRVTVVRLIDALCPVTFLRQLTGLVGFFLLNV